MRVVVFACLCLAWLGGAGAASASAEGGPSGAQAFGTGEDPTRLMVHVSGANADDRAKGQGAEPRAVTALRTRLEGLRVRIRPAVPPAMVTKALKSDPELWSRPALQRVAGWFVVELADPVAQLEARERLRGVAGVDAIEPAYLHELCQVPNDAHISSQTYLGLIRAYDAFAEVRASDEDVLVAIVDGGSEWLHEDLRANVWSRPHEIEGNGIDDDGNGYVDDVHGWNFATDSPDPTGLENTPRNADHGTHIAGVVSAVTDNGIGVAGVSWNAKLLLINESHPQIDRGIRGYDGLLYAALSGADIVNASWGRVGRWSQFEADVIGAVTDLGTLVVAAAGNSISGLAFYPAFYPGVLSVTRVGNGLQFHPGSNADSWIDVAAPGSLVHNLLAQNSYGALGGTSQSAAIVSGVAALVQSRHPDWTPAQIREQIRWTTSPIVGLDPELVYRTGTGVVDAFRAVTESPPGLRMGRLTVLDQDEDQRVEPGEMVVFAFDLVNELAASDRVRIHMEIDDPDVVPLQQTLVLGRVGAGTTLPITRGLSAWIKDNAQMGRLVPVRFVIESDVREVHQVFYEEILPLHATAAAGRLEVTVTANGKIGFSHVTRPRDPGGVGIRRPGGPSFMLGGSLLVGDGPDRVSDALISPTPTGILEDFTPQLGEAMRFPPAPRADVEIVSVYADRSSGRPLGVFVEQTTLAYQDSARDGFVISVYDLSSTEDLTGVRAGFLVDWELPAEEFNRDEIRFDPAHRLVYVVNHGTEPLESAGVALLRGPGSVDWNWLYDLPVEGEDQPFLYDPNDFSRKIPDADLWRLLTEPGGEAPSPVAGVGSVISCGPFDLRSGEQERMVLAFVMGNDLEELRHEVESARIAFEGIEEGIYGGLPTPALLLPNVPNPFNPRTDVRFTLPSEGRVRVTIYDSRGRHVVSLLDEVRAAGFHRVPWLGVDAGRARVSSGVYHVELRTPSGSDRRSMTLIR